MSPEEAGAMAIAIAAAIGHDWAAESWRFKVEHMPQQTDDVECGIFLLVAALYVIADKPLLQRFEPQPWRRLFRSAASGRPRDVAEGLVGVQAQQQSVDAVAKTLERLTSWKIDAGNARDAIAVTGMRLHADSTRLSGKVEAFSRAREIARSLLDCIEPLRPGFLREPALSIKQRERLQASQDSVAALWQAADHMYGRLAAVIDEGAQQLDASLSRFKR